MKRKAFIIGIVALAVAGILFGCIRPIDPSQSMGSVTISLASGGKTVQPPLSLITVTSYTVSGTGPGGATVPLTPKASSAFTISDLLAGAWTFTINGLDASGNIIATGTVNVTIIPAETVSAEVQLAPLSAGGATGTFTLAATWTAPLSITSIGGTITPAGGAAQPFAATIDGSAASYSNTMLPVGSYTLFVSATEAGGGSFQAIYALRIYKNLVSPLVLALTASDFTPIVAAPILSPGAGTYSSTQTVTITSATEGASIRYTIDGTTPSETEGTVYSSPLSVSSSKTIKAIAYMTGMQTSSVTSAAYVITGAVGINVTDPWIPTITFSGEEASIVYGSSMTVTATVSPAPDSYAWYLDGQVIAGAVGTSVTLGSSALLGTHTVTLIVMKGTKIASEEFAFTVTATTTIPRSGLVAEYLFNGNANDTSGNGNNGVVNGATLAADRFGNMEKAYDFDGLNDYIILDRNNGLRFPWTFSAWVRTNDISKIQSIYCSDEHDWYWGDYNGFNISLQSMGHCSMIGCGIPRNNSYWTTRVPSMTHFEHVVVVFNSITSVEYYINNVVFPVTSEGGFLTPTFRGSPDMIGRSYDGLNRTFFNGSIDDIRIYDRALSNTEIQALYDESI